MEKSICIKKSQLISYGMQRNANGLGVSKVKLLAVFIMQTPLRASGIIFECCSQMYVGLGHSKIYARLMEQSMILSVRHALLEDCWMMTRNGSHVLQMRRYSLLAGLYAIFLSLRCYMVASLTLLNYGNDFVIKFVTILTTVYVL